MSRIRFWRTISSQSGSPFLCVHEHYYDIGETRCTPAGWRSTTRSMTLCAW